MSQKNIFDLSGGPDENAEQQHLQTILQEGANDKVTFFTQTVPWTSSIPKGQLFTGDICKHWNDAEWFLLLRTNSDNGYLDVFVGIKLASLPDDWHLTFNATFVLVHNNPSKNRYAEAVTRHTFRKPLGQNSGLVSIDIGKTQLFEAPLENLLTDPGFTNDGCFQVECRLEELVIKGHMRWNYDSKTETGMVGLQNLGATCYLNALLQ
eukprot:gene6734-13632_t